jgi:hypothetical protein
MSETTYQSTRPHIREGLDLQPICTKRKMFGKKSSEEQGNNLTV